MSGYHVRRIIYFFLCITLLYVTFRILSPNGGYLFPREIIIVDRHKQLQEIDDLIHSVTHNPHAWGESKKACRHPVVEVNSPDLMKFVKPSPQITCSGEEDWVEVIGSTARITQIARKKYGDIECSFTDIIWSDDFSTKTGLTTTTHTEYNLESSDFVRVRCASESGKKWWTILSGVRHDQDILDRSGWHHLKPSALKLNILMFGFDSISSNSFVRKLPLSYKYLTEELNAVILKGYNIVGDGTPQALIPILTGRTELELPDTRKRMGRKAVFVNVYPFIWNEFRNNGYVTAFMEDTPSVGIFSYRLKGFNEEPTDHYMRTFFVDAEPDYSKFSPFCIGSIPRHKIMLDYAKHMMTVYRERPKFVFGFHGEVSHDDYNLVGGADQDLLDWLTWLHKANHLNNTILILMSDHGHRFAEIRNTEQGKIEERMPWFSFVLPPWFDKVYPEAGAALRSNSDILTTPFDIHATLRSVLFYSGPKHQQDLQDRALSLFHKIPLERTCSDAYIEPHWCGCLEWQSSPTTDLTVLRAAKKFVEFINKFNSRFVDVCEILSLDSVLWAAKLIPSSALRQFKHSADVDGFIPKMGKSTEVSLVTYQIKVSTVPGKALYEFSVTHHIIRDQFKFRIEDVSRINRYGEQANCIEKTSEHLRKFCYCKGYIEDSA